MRRRFLPVINSQQVGSDGDTGPRNNSSVITLLQLDNVRLLLTGDAGIPALEAAADVYEAIFQSFQAYPLRFIQAPH